MSAHAETAETELLARCRRGESAGWDELFDRYYPAACRFVYQLGYEFTREDVEEICQEVFFAVVRTLDGFKGHSQFQTWLFRIAANKARDYRQRQNAAKRGGGQVALSLDVEDPINGRAVEPPCQLPGPDAVAIQLEDIALVGQALAELGGPCEEILALRYFGDLSYEEIARSLGLHPKTVSSRLSKCLDKLEVVARGILRREKKAAASV